MPMLSKDSDDESGSDDDDGDPATLFEQKAP
jgi:hypothetical protein